MSARRPEDRAEQQLRERKIRDRSLILLLIGITLLMPPVATAFSVPATIGGIPVVFVYVLAVWALLIAGARALAHRLQNTEATTSPPRDDGQA